ncbi:uncharacterized protein [Globicephala melas]|uniref:uncharacterized protein n=1 Tax=Globicephala melas TaxID=9731 RepID=UPI003872F1C6
MAWTPLLLMLLSHCTGALAQPVLTQPPSLSSNLGASARLTCTLSSGFNVGNFWIRWYQQKPGNPPRYLLTFHSDSDKHQGSGVPSRFTGSNDASTNAGILLISGLQPEDEADYYCATYHGNSKAFTVLQTHGEVRQKSPHCSALLTKEAWKFLPPPPASGSWAQSRLTQEGFMSGSVGQTVTHSCTGNGNNVGASIVNWYQQIFHGAPKTAMLAGSLPSGIPDLCSGSTSVNTASLTISRLQPEDKADYYCSTWDDSISGAVSQTVLTQPPSLSASPGASASLTCTLSSGYIVGGYHISATASPGQMATLSCPGNSNNVGSEGAACAATTRLGPQSPDPQESQPAPRVSEGFLGSRSGGGASLSISGLQAEAEADYSCSAWDGRPAPHPVLPARWVVSPEP